MLIQCEEHGFFRAGKCPICKKESRFLMDDYELEKLGRIMAGILRHFPEKFNLQIDEHGWIELYKFVYAVKIQSKFRWLKEYHIKAIVETDDKGRYEIKENRIRATYGHTINVDLDLPTENIPDKLYYPATLEEADIILETGLKPIDRKKVHLSLTEKDAKVAGLYRNGNPIILEVDVKKAIENGIVIQKAGKTVFLVDEIPKEYLKRIDG